MLAKLINFVKSHQIDIILVIGVILISLLSFAAGYIVAKKQEKEPLRFEEINQSNKDQVLQTQENFYENSKTYSFIS